MSPRGIDYMRNWWAGPTLDVDRIMDEEAGAGVYQHLTAFM